MDTTGGEPFFLLIFEYMGPVRRAREEDCHGFGPVVVQSVPSSFIGSATRIPSSLAVESIVDVYGGVLGRWDSRHVEPSVLHSTVGGG